MLKRWKARPGAERLQVQLLVIGAVIGLYFLVFFQLSNGKYQESVKMLNRKKDRIEKRTDMGKLDSGGVSPKIIEGRIQEVEDRIQDVSGSFDELDTGFAPLDSSDFQQQLRLEISTLADRTGVALLSMGRKGVSPEGDIGKAPIDKELGRPLLVVTANTRFWPLIDFLHGLKDLTFYASVMHLNLSVQAPEVGRKQDSVLPPGVLYVYLEVSM